MYGRESHQLGQLGADGLALAGDVVSQGVREFLINNAHVRQCRRTTMMTLGVTSGVVLALGVAALNLALDGVEC